MMRARKDAQDRESIDRSSIEYSRSGTDSSVAQNEEASFDPKTTRPEQELEKAGEGNEVSYTSLRLHLFCPLIAFAVRLPWDRVMLCLRDRSEEQRLT